MSLFSRWFRKRTSSHGSPCVCEPDEAPCERRNEGRRQTEADKQHIERRIDQQTQRMHWLELQADVESRRKH